MCITVNIDSGGTAVVLHLGITPWGGHKLKLSTR